MSEPSIEVLVSTVFNPDYTVKNCGREACRTLILELQKLDPTLNFGNEETGILNVDVIRSFLQKL